MNRISCDESPAGADGSGLRVDQIPDRRCRLKVGGERLQEACETRGAGGPTQVGHELVEARLQRAVGARGRRGIGGAVRERFNQTIHVRYQP